jgi:hypothetical protein
LAAAAKDVGEKDQAAPAAAAKDMTLIIHKLITYGSVFTNKR